MPKKPPIGLNFVLELFCPTPFSVVLVNSYALELAFRAVFSLETRPAGLYQFANASSVRAT